MHYKGGDVFSAAMMLNSPLIGASGAIMGVMLAFATFYPDSRILLFFVIPMKASTLLLITFVVETLFLIPGLGGNTANVTHLMGLLLGYFYLWLRKDINAGKIIINSVKNKY